MSFVLIFGGLAWLEWHGAWGWILLGLLGLEMALTVADSVVEDRTRVLRPSERINHMLLAFNTGAYTALVGWQVANEWRHEPTALLATRHPVVSEPADGMCRRDRDLGGPRWHRSPPPASSVSRSPCKRQLTTNSSRLTGPEEADHFEE